MIAVDNNNEISNIAFPFPFILNVIKENTE